MILKKQQRNTFFPFWTKVFLLLFFVCIPTFSFAQYQSSTSFKIENPTIVIGSGKSTSASFQYLGSTGEFVIGESEGVDFTQRAGFLYFPSLESAPPEEEENDGGGGGSGSKVIITPEVIEYISDPDHIRCRIADFNCDSYVNILDLSILLYYATLQFDEKIKPFDLNSDNKIDLIDISIMLYYWDK